MGPLNLSWFRPSRSPNSHSFCTYLTPCFFIYRKPTTLCRCLLERLKHGTVSRTNAYQQRQARFTLKPDRVNTMLDLCWCVSCSVQRVQKKTSTMSLTISSTSSTRELSSCSASSSSSSTLVAQRHSSLVQPLCVSPQRVVSSTSSESSRWTNNTPQSVNMAYACGVCGNSYTHSGSFYLQSRLVVMTDLTIDLSCPSKVTDCA